MNIKIEIKRITGDNNHVGNISLDGKNIAVFSINDNELMKLKDNEILKEDQTDKGIYQHSGVFKKL
ncbi:MAG: hypothetical protein NTZ33_04925 [Bacteroidetes bacterium]|nr:hypothetical protein [Bacteroidota bacterium]